jgi:hypothetical protein
MSNSAPAFGQGQPTRHGRVVFRVFGGERGPQLPVALGTGHQAAEQRVPLFGLVAGDADVDLAVHAFLEQVGQAGEQVVEAGEAFFSSMPTSRICSGTTPPSKR